MKLNWIIINWIIIWWKWTAQEPIELVLSSAEVSSALLQNKLAKEAIHAHNSSLMLFTLNQWFPTGVASGPTIIFYRQAATQENF